MSKAIGWVVAGVGALVVVFLFLRRPAATPAPAPVVQQVAPKASKSVANDVAQWIQVAGVAAQTAQNAGLW